jgi:hypothetical protein
VVASAVEFVLRLWLQMLLKLMWLVWGQALRKLRRVVGAQVVQGLMLVQALLKLVWLDWGQALLKRIWGVLGGSAAGADVGEQGLMWVQALLKLM